MSLPLSFKVLAPGLDWIRFVAADTRRRFAAGVYRRRSATRGRIGVRMSLVLASLAACAGIFVLTGAYAQSDKAGSGSEGIGAARSVHRGAGPRMSGQCRPLGQETCYPNCNLRQRRTNMRRWSECMRRKRIPGWAPLPIPTQ